MKQIVRTNYILFSLLLLYLLAGIAILFLFEKGEFELLVNKHHEPYFDLFFFYITYLGDARILVPIVILVSLRKRYNGLLTLMTFLISTIIVQFMKRSLFAEYPRPSKYFENLIDIHVIEGLELHSYYSFPSGHSSGVFAVFFMLALLMKNKSTAIIYFSIALLASFSRIYLMQHFFMDTFFGALIGVSCTIMIYYYIDLKSSLPEKEFFKRPLFKFFEEK